PNLTLLPSRHSRAGPAARSFALLPPLDLAQGFSRSAGQGWSLGLDWLLLRTNRCHRAQGALDLRRRRRLWRLPDRARVRTCETTFVPRDIRCPGASNPKSPRHIASSL